MLHVGNEISFYFISTQKKNTKMRYKRKSIDKWSAIGKFNRFLARVLNLLRDNCAVKNKIDFRPKFDSKFAHIISEY